ncbi:SDR family NAD(P)-dependent oxidoreductase [Aliidiomarina maris]|uniref:Dihydromonapterin reductase n=1 Tax=Aliidiomarina maris TaxID=531312 RepID=A0A327X548_9GAMM|nr:SDR family NAD(P)-dependent oxidoreductase [Aliidiomarina maris]RAK01779.1 dihydromonapterin reductase/dihydrofolate reductase [Aliidiomarina maris]RUO28593.1 short-chain dehydrogenase [Aliidiomarina maris]
MNTQPNPVAVITGASRRLGLHMTQSFLQQGWQVIVLTRDCGAGELANIDNPNLTCIECDALNDESVSAAIGSIRQATQHVDLLLHNASIYEKDQQHQSDPVSFYNDLYAIHMKLPARLNTALADLLKESVREQGNIIHITDIYVANPNPEYALYCSTKAGSENLMLSFAKRLAPTVRVNAIQPGPVKFLPEHSSDDQSKVLAETLLAVEGGFEALEKAIYAILDNHYMTASVVRVDGGRAMA